MGDRRQIVLHYPASKKQDGTIYVYTHWVGGKLPLILAIALNRGRDRWEDITYLGRIITSQVFADAGIMDSTGAGISPYDMDSEYDDLHVFLTNQVVTIARKKWTYEDFIREFIEDN